MNCRHCGQPLTPNAGPKTDLAWCSDACLKAWEAEDPTRSQGWVSVSDLTPEKLREAFSASGLDMKTHAGKVVIQ